MLVLSRKIGESIQIAGDIKVTVTEVRGGRVRLSIEAPPSIRIMRKEIADGDVFASSPAETPPEVPGSPEGSH